MNEELIQKVYSYPFLSRLKLRNFKSVGDQEVSLAPLTLIVGENSSGKSSLLQAIRLMQQAIRAKTPGTVFPLNGDEINMGAFNEIRSAKTGDQDKVLIEFNLLIPAKSLSFICEDKDHFCDDTEPTCEITKTRTIG